MARYTLATKISETDHNHIYEICNDSKIPDCYAILNATSKNIKIYSDSTFKKLIFDYTIFNDEEANKKQLSRYYPSQHLFIRVLTNLISAVKNNSFPKYLDRCS